MPLIRLLLYFCAAWLLCFHDGVDHRRAGKGGEGERRNVRVLKANYIQSSPSSASLTTRSFGCVLDLSAIHARRMPPQKAISHPKPFCMATVPTILIQEIDEAAGKDRIRMDVYFT
ncbi:hypothetical protein ZWY2020_059966 [Hordeum vulgare]|nr:hypothetical protein ZWY2020_059966 [Hordeum vulgare]